MRRRRATSPARRTTIPSPAPRPAAARARRSARPSGSAGSRRADGESIPGAAHGPDEPVMPGRRQRFAQPADVDVDGSFLDVDVAAPNAVEELRTAVDAIRMAHEELEQTVLRGAERDLGAAGADLMARGVELQRAGADDFAIRGFEPAQSRPDPRQQLARRERLHDVIVGAAVETRDAIVLLAARRQHDDGDLLRLGIALELPRELEAADVGQHPVHQDEVGALVGDRSARLARVGCRRNGVPGSAEIETHHLADRALVLDYEDSPLGHRQLLSQSECDHWIAAILQSG